jgi:PAS domain S-box-containing protein
MPTQVKRNTKVQVHAISLKSFARFILDDHLEEFAEKSLSLSRERKVPLLKYLKGMSPATLKSLAEKGSIELLTCLSEGRASEHTQNAVKRWLADQLPMIEKDQVVVEDITLVMRVRKELFLHFIPKYTKDINAVLDLVNEIDDYLLEYSSVTIKAFNNLMEGKIREQVLKTEEANKSLKQAQAITHIGSYDWDLMSNRLTWSDELYRIYELDANTDLSDASVIRPFNHPDDAEIVSKHIGTSRQTLKPFDFYYRIVLPDKREKTLHARGEIIADNSGNAVRIIGTAQDVTNEKHLERRLIENQNFIKKIADATPAIIASYNIKTGRYVFVNDSIKTLLGYEPDIIFEKGIEFITSIVHPDDLGRIMEENNKALQASNDQFTENGKEPIAEFQYRMKHHNGEYRWFHTFGTIFDRDANHQVEHVLNISLDITERVKAEQVIHQRTAELQQSNASLEEFAFVASHDLKEPLRKIITFSDRLLGSQQNQLTDDGRGYLEKIMNSSIRMQQMVNDLLSLSVIAADKSFSKVNLKKLFDEVLMAFEYKVEETKAKFEIADLPEAEVVPAQFRQLFQNLVSNSLKFAKKDVAPLISIGFTFLLPSEVPTQQIQKADRYLKLEVSDNGIGFDNTYGEKIFAVFQRLHAREHYEGTGIGLAICKKIVENHGGVVFASGQLQQGATFTIIIPQ